MVVVACGVRGLVARLVQHVGHHSVNNQLFWWVSSALAPALALQRGRCPWCLLLVGCLLLHLLNLLVTLDLLLHQLYQHILRHGDQLLLWLCLRLLWRIQASERNHLGSDGGS